jgi:hypothetical protein
MKTTVSVYDFRQAFQDHNRQDSFSYEGLGALYEWIEQLDDDCGTETELDVIALCCDFSEYDSALDCIDECGYDFKPEPFTCDDCGEDTDPEQATCEHCDDPIEDYDSQIWRELAESAALAYLNDHTMVIVFDSGIIIQGF